MFDLTFMMRNHATALITLLSAVWAGCSVELMGQSQPQSATVIIESAGLGEVAGVKNGPLDMGFNTEKSVDLPEGGGEITITAACNVHILVKTKWESYDHNGNAVSQEETWENEGGKVYLFKGESSDYLLGDEPPDSEATDGQPTNEKKNFSIKLVPADAVEEVDPEKPENEGHPGAGPPAARPVINANNCCNGELGTEPRLARIQGSEVLGFENNSSVAHYEFPLGGMFSSSSPYPISLGTLVFKADPSVDNLAQSWPALFEYIEGPALLNDPGSVSTPSSGVYQTPSYKFEMSWENGGVEIRQYKRIPNGGAGTLNLVRRYTIVQVELGSKFCFEFSHFKDAATVAYRTDRYFSEPTSVTQRETIWEHDDEDGKRIERVTKNVQMEATPNQSNNFLRSTITTTRESFEHKNGLIYPTAYQHTEHQILRYDTGQPYFFLRLNTHLTGVGVVKEKKAYTYDYNRPSFVEAKTYQKEGSAEHLTGSEAFDYDDHYRVNPWLNVAVDSMSGIRLRNDRDSDLLVLAPGASPNSRYDRDTATSIRLYRDRVGTEAVGGATNSLGVVNGGVIRKLHRKTNVLGRFSGGHDLLSTDMQESPAWRQYIVDYYVANVKDGTHKRLGQGATQAAAGELFRRIERSGLVTEYGKEAGFTPDAGQLANYPASGGPYKVQLRGENLKISYIGSNFSSASKNSVKVPFKSTLIETIRGRHGVVSETTKVWDDTAWVAMSSTRYLYNSGGKLQSVTKDGETIQSYSYPNANTEEVTDANGQVTVRTTDANGEVTTTLKGAPATQDWEAQPDVVMASDETPSVNSSTPPLVIGISRTQTRSAGALSLSESTSLDLDGRTLSRTDETGVQTTYASTQVNGYATETVSRASGAHTLTSSRYLDGQRREEAGTGQVSRVYTYDIKTTAPKGIEETETISGGSAQIINKRLTTADGELISETVNGVTTAYAYDECGRLVSRTTTGPVGNRVYRYEYDYRNLVQKEGWDVNGDGNLTAGSTDVIVEHENYYEFADNAWWLVSKRSTYLEDGNSAVKQTTTTREKQGAGSGSVTQVIYPDNLAETTTRSVSGKVVTTTVTSERFPGRTSTQVVYNGRLVSSQDFSQSKPVVYGYDALGRQVRVFDTGAEQAQLTSYDPVTGQTTTSKNGANEVTSYGYYPATSPNAGQVHWVQNNAGEKTYYAYNLLGKVTHQWGNGSQPLRYVYDGLGQIQTLDTYTSVTPAAWSGDTLPAAFASTASNLISSRSFALTAGRLSERTYGPGAGGVGYQYNADGSLHQRTWAGASANRATTYSYTPAGQLGGIDYADATPDVIFSYDRSGRSKTRLDAGGFRVFTHEADGDVQETVSGGLLDGLTMTKHLNSAGQVESLEWSFAGVSQKASYNYDSQKRLEAASLGPVSGDPLVTASYTYHPDTHRVKTLTRPLGEGVPLLGTWTQDVLGRLDTLIWQRGVVTYGGHDYQLDAAGRRRQETRLDGTRLEYTYSARGELESAVRKRVADGSTRPDWSHEYDYDDSGSRTSSTTPEGETLTHAFGPGPGPVPTASTKHWLRGRANPQATVTVGGHAATREGEVWRYLLVNPSAPAAQRTTVTAARPDLDPAPTPMTQTVTLPADTGIYAFDERGNLTSDSQWVYAWDLENRLVSQEQKFPGISGDGAQPVKRLEFAYDGLSRRISKKVLSNERESDGDLVNANWTFEKETIFLWQDWTLVAEFVRMTSAGSLSLRRGYLWGLDVDGTLGGAGGVGGLLWVADYVPGVTGSNRQLAPWYDGNGNVMGWVENEGAQKLPLHRLEYDPYGKLLVEEDVRVARTKKQRDLGVATAWLDRPAFGFSTKYEDVETGLSYYGYRYYSPEMGRWLSRDPIGEEGGINLYGIGENDPVNRWDLMGLKYDKDFSPNYKSIISLKIPSSSLTFYQENPRDPLSISLVRFYFRNLNIFSDRGWSSVNDTYDISNSYALKYVIAELIDENHMEFYFQQTLRQKIQGLRAEFSGPITFHIASQEPVAIPWSEIDSKLALQRFTVSYELKCKLSKYSCGGVCKASFSLWDLYDFSANGEILAMPLELIFHTVLGTPGLRFGTNFHVRGEWQKKYKFDHQGEIFETSFIKNYDDEKY